MDERTRILAMLRDGKLSVEDADRLLRALATERDRPDAARGHMLRIRVSGHRGERVNVAVPRRAPPEAGVTGAVPRALAPS